MSRITQSTDFDRIQTLEDLKRFLNKFGEDVVNQVNGGLNFTDNFSGQETSITFASADTDSAVPHNLGRVPTGYIVTGATVAMGVYDGATAWTTANLYLRSSAAGIARLLIY